MSEIDLSVCQTCVSKLTALQSRITELELLYNHSLESLDMMREHITALEARYDSYELDEAEGALSVAESMIAERDRRITELEAQLNLLSAANELNKLSASELWKQLKAANEDCHNLNSVALLAQEYLEGLIIRSAHNRLMTEEMTPVIDKINSVRELYLSHLSAMNDRARVGGG